jgi:hypothetical protein
MACSAERHLSIIPLPGNGKNDPVYLLRPLLSILILFSFLLIPKAGFSQNSPDTLSLVRTFIMQGKVHPAFVLMKDFSRHHPGDFNAAWLFAKAAYLDDQIMISGKQYEKAIRLSPDNLYAQLDYADFLVSTGRYEQARYYLDKYLKYEPGNYKAMILLARIDYWQADYREAMKTLGKISGMDSTDISVANMKRDIHVAASPWLGINAGYFSDNQPMQGMTAAIDAGLAIHPHVLPYVKFRVPVFDTSANVGVAAWLQAGNRSVFAKPRMRLDVSLGIVQFPSGNSSSWSGSAELTKVFIYHLPVTLTVCQNPYFSTLGSISRKIMEDHISLSAGWDRINSFYGQATFDVAYYPYDRSEIFTGNGWFFTPPVRGSVLKVRVGYGFAYSTSQTNNFVNKEPVEQIINTFDPSVPIDGVYSPYFTPKNQQINSLLVNVKIIPSKNFTADLTGNFGVFATADIPYFYLDTIASGTVIDKYIMQGKTFFVIRDFSNHQKFFPVQATAKLLFRVSPTIHIEGDYTFYSTYYFVRHYAGIGIKINFTDGGS